MKTSVTVQNILYIEIDENSVQTADADIYRNEVNICVVNVLYGDEKKKKKNAVRTQIRIQKKM